MLKWSNENEVSKERESCIRLADDQRNDWLVRLLNRPPKAPGVVG